MREGPAARNASAAALLAVLLAAPAAAAEKVPAERPPEWAQPVALAGVGNLHRVTPLLYRSEQPTKAGMANLEAFGVKTVIDLRAFHSDKKALAGTKLKSVDLDIKTWRIKDDDVVRVLRAVRRKEDGPFLIHCKHGADRTGVMSAMYRLVEEGWSKEAALKELREGGYGYHSVWKNIVRYVEKVDVAALRRRVEAP
jgi:protein tyrosine/serine phosphatase